MANPVAELQQLTNKSIIELYSVELKADVHYTKSAKTAAYSQSGQTITITLNSHGFIVGLILSLKFTSGNGIDGVYTIQTVATNTFTVTAKQDRYYLLYYYQHGINKQWVLLF